MRASGSTSCGLQIKIIITILTPTWPPNSSLFKKKKKKKSKFHIYSIADVELHKAQKGTFETRTLDHQVWPSELILYNITIIFYSLSCFLYYLF